MLNRLKLTEKLIRNGYKCRSPTNAFNKQRSDVNLSPFMPLFLTDFL